MHPSRQPSLAAARVMLVIFHRGRARVLPLAPGRPAIVGRGQRADAVIDDETISREHTRFELRDGQVWVEDLESKNGTLVNGQRIQRRRIDAGDKLAIGAATVAVHVDALAACEIPGVESHEQLRAALAEQVAPASRGRGPALIVVRVGPLPSGPAPEPDEQWLARIVPLTGPYDRLAAYSEREAEVLLGQASAARAIDFARSVVAALGAGRARCGVACLPDAASTADALVEAAWAAARRATDTDPVQVAGNAAHREVVGGEELVVASPQMRRVYATVDRLARSAIPVLISGETGTGKELVARAIHERSERGGRMLCVNCAAIPETLIESELFGHERGAFTGASRQSRGVFEEADRGSVFLDEIGELSPAGQAALLRVLETKRLCRVGSKREIAVDVRIIAATNRGLDAMCDSGAFRSDLLYRINAVVLELPPLRQRREEIASLAQHFCERASRDCGCAPKAISPEVVSLLTHHPWPGNVRELRNVIDRGVALAAGEAIEVEHLPPRILEASVAAAAEASRPLLVSVIEGERGPAATGFRSFIQRTEAAVIATALAETGWKMAATAGRINIPLRTMNDRVRACGIDRQFCPEPDLLQALDHAVPPGTAADFKDRIRRYEAALIRWALQTCEGRRADVAARLGIPARTLRDKIRAYGLD